MIKTVKFVGKKVDCILDLQTLNLDEQHAELNGRLFSRHKNPDGTTGGFVEKTAKVAKTVYIGPKTLVFDNAWVSGHARVSGHAWVCGDAEVYDNAIVYGDARVYGVAHIFGDARVCGNTEIKCGSINIDYVFASTAQVEEYLKSVNEMPIDMLVSRLDKIGAINILRK
ncbi:MAG: hypothetical protein M1385_02865 [Candidatus Marsarchaeota archaeon]|nr:hypothetical protein [Candidatus Marsarchaeota archaeon]